MCSICLDEIKENDKVVTDCNHEFHLSCLLKNYENGVNGKECPNCRKSLIPEVPNDVIVNKDRVDSDMDVILEMINMNEIREIERISNDINGNDDVYLNIISNFILSNSS